MSMRLLTEASRTEAPSLEERIRRAREELVASEKRFNRQIAEKSVTREQLARTCRL